ncbi:MAG: ClbS/DfsB family four-helix bundle protein [Chloroflexi bacterium]|nr:ClbS/DfsB family four-helix bundle protein [Chloroflexota bacterium]
MTKAAGSKAITTRGVLDALETQGARLLKVVEGLGEERASKPIVGEWSARDVLAHCIYWTGMLARMMGVRGYPPPAWIPRWQAEAQLGTDELNRLTVEHYRKGPFQTVVDDFRFTKGLVRDVVDFMKEENLLLPAGAPWGEGTKVWEAIASETHDHWRQHAEELEKALSH